MTFKIEKDIPLPTDSEPRAVSWPFRIMNPGDSVTIPEPLRIKATNALRSFEQRSPRKFTKRVLADGSLRIWRVS